MDSELYFKSTFLGINKEHKFLDNSFIFSIFLCILTCTTAFESNKSFIWITTLINIKAMYYGMYLLCTNACTYLDLL